MMRRLTVLGVFCVLTLPSLALAQTTAKPSPQVTVSQTSAPTINEWYIGGHMGVGIVDGASFVVNAEAGYRVWKHLDLLMEGGYSGDLATHAGKDKAAAIATVLQNLSGQPASSSLTIPSGYLTIGGRWVFEARGKYRPYALVTIGGAYVNVKSKFTVGGQDVTGSLGDAGITLGNDLTGSYRPFAVDFGFGVLRPWGHWVFDGSVRIMNVATNDNHTNLTRVLVGMARRF